MEQVIRAVLNRKDEIWAFCQANRASSEQLEGANKKLGVLTRIAYRFVDAGTFGPRASLLTPGMQS